MSLSTRILSRTLLGFIFTEAFLLTACNNSKTFSSKSQGLQFIFSPASGTSFSTDSIISVVVIDPSPVCRDISDGNGLFFVDTRIDKCTMTVNGVDSGSAYESGFVCNDNQTQGAPLLHLPLQASVCYGGATTFTVTVTCTQGGNLVDQGTATYSCVY